MAVNNSSTTKGILMSSPHSLELPSELESDKERIKQALLALLRDHSLLGDYGICFYLSKRIDPNFSQPISCKRDLIYSWVGNNLSDLYPNIYTAALHPYGEMTPGRIKLAQHLLSQLS